MYIKKKIIAFIMLLVLSLSETALAAVSLPPSIQVKAAILLDITADDDKTEVKLTKKELKRRQKELEKQRRREEKERRRKGQGSTTTVNLERSSLKKETATDAAAFFPPLPEAKVLYERNADDNRAPASLTKMMTALVAVKESRYRKLDMSRPINIRWDEAEETNWLVSGEIIPFAEALAQMMIISDNGAAYAIARQTGSDGKGKDGVAGFYQRMNDYAGAMKLTGSYFADASGLPTPGHVSTARDMATIARYLLKDDDLKPIVGTKYRNIKCIYPRNHRVKAENTNDLLFDYPGCYGLKTGYTNAAGFCLAAVAERNGRRLLTVVMGGDKPDDRFTAAARLLNYGFEAIKG